MPAALAIIAATFTDARERTAAIGISGAIGALGLALGPAIGGVISQHLHWGWIFLINVPLGVITLAIAIPFVAESRAAQPVPGWPGHGPRRPWCGWTCPGLSPPRSRSSR